MLGKIFINYRRESTTDTAGRLYERTAEAFGHENPFVDCIGVDLNARLNSQVAKCQVFLTVIGSQYRRLRCGRNHCGASPQHSRHTRFS
jgi:hypothetical protein